MKNRCELITRFIIETFKKVKLCQNTTLKTIKIVDSIPIYNDTSNQHDGNGSQIEQGEQIEDDTTTTTSTNENEKNELFLSARRDARKSAKLLGGFIAGPTATVTTDYVNMSHYDDEQYHVRDEY